ncbi:unnamed protein product [Eruca vesicaria subsp. sativa]|uniref:Uncharacterized protein n=1 Tax=Eruca vesicaria subsp. sativa TaxID=29727 RepID=A0ABC8L1P7_ERUVS|nr:unnamed protein product [Eruca vesicaria subsp. sativa]
MPGPATVTALKTESSKKRGRCAASCPSSMRSSPMDELQSAIQGAISHCKNSIITIVKVRAGKAASQHQVVQRQDREKSAIVQVDAAPFKQWGKAYGALQNRSQARQWYKAAIKADPLCYEVLLALYSIDVYVFIMKSFGANVGG